MSRTIENATNTIRSTAQNAITNVQSQVVNTMSGIESAISQTTSSFLNQATSAANQAQSAASKLLSSGFGGSDIISQASNIGKSLFGSTSGLFSEVDVLKNTKLNNYTTDTLDSIKNSLSNVTNSLNIFNNNSQNLNSSGLTFVASTTNKAIDGIDLPGADVFTDFINMGKGQLSKLSNLGSEVLNSGKNAIKAVSESLQTAYNTGKSIANNIISGVTTTVSTVLKPIQSTYHTVTDLLNPHNVANVVNSNLDFLPNNIRSVISGAAANASAKALSAVNSTISETMGLDRLFGSNANAVLNYVMSFGNDYPNRTDINGSKIEGLDNFSGSDSDYDQLVNLLTTLCHEAGNAIPETINFSSQKALYDMLMALLVSSGAGGLALALMNCKDRFGDDRTNQIMGRMMGTAAFNGDPYTTLLTYEYGGSAFMSEPAKLMTTLLANSGNDNDNAINIAKLMELTGINVNGLISVDTLEVLNTSRPSTYDMRAIDVDMPIPVYDCATATVLQATCTDHLDDAVGMRDRNLINQVYATWH